MCLPWGQRKPGHLNHRQKKALPRWAQEPKTQGAQVQWCWVRWNSLQIKDGQRWSDTIFVADPFCLRNSLKSIICRHHCTVQQHNGSRLQHHNSTPLQHCHIVALQHYSFAANQHYDNTWQYTITTQDHHTISPMRHSTNVAPQHFSITTIWQWHTITANKQPTNKKNTHSRRQTIPNKQ